jgi:hypothetical protein
VVTVVNTVVTCKIINAALGDVVIGMFINIVTGMIINDALDDVGNPDVPTDWDVGRSNIDWHADVVVDTAHSGTIFGISSGMRMRRLALYA